MRNNKLILTLPLLFVFLINPTLIYAKQNKKENHPPAKQQKLKQSKSQQTEQTEQTKQNKTIKSQLADSEKKAEQKVNDILSSLTPKETSALQKKLKEEKQAERGPFGISLYRPNYILPLYYTGSPDQEVYKGNTPDNQRIQNAEFKVQLSLKDTLFRYKKASLNVAYTQLSYWQVYAKSQYFRETNYEPEIFVSYNFHKNWLADFGVVHQSNGRGGKLERSWNRAYINLSLSGAHWLVSIKPWILIFKADSSDLHNPDIARFLGYERMLFAFKFHKQVLTVQFRNTFESGFKRGAITASWSIPIKGHISAYVQFFSGYGQSLIEYNHYTNSVGIGIALNDWI